MNIINNAVVEYNEDGYLIYSESFRGAYVRGKTLDEALKKFPNEIKSYCKWAGINFDDNSIIESKIVQKKKNSLKICDADSDVIFNSEINPISSKEYENLKHLVIKSAHDFKELYESIPDKNATSLNERKTFYGVIPRTAEEMYTHTNNVTNYYVGEIGIEFENIPDILESRVQAFNKIQASDGYLLNKVYNGSYNEDWSLRKVLRRFIWHDRIHAKAMYRMASKIWGAENIDNPFFF